MSKNNLLCSVIIRVQLPSSRWFLLQKQLLIAQRNGGKACLLLLALLLVTCAAFASPPRPTAPAFDKDGSFTVSASLTNQGYELYRMEGPGVVRRSTSGGRRYYTIEGLPSGRYGYKSIYCSDGGSGIPCREDREDSLYAYVDVVHTPGIPTSVSFSPASLSCSSNFTVSWGAAAGGNRYQLQERKRLSGGSWSSWTTLTSNAINTTYARNSLTAGYNYQYAVRARYFIGDHYSDWGSYRHSAELRKPYCPPGIPGSATFSPTNPLTTSSYTVSWGASTGTVATYELQEQFNAGGWSIVQNTSGRSKTFSNRAHGSYCYRIRARNIDASGNYSAAQCVTVRHPIPGTPGAITISGLSHPGSRGDNNGIFTLNWGVASGVITAYKLQQRQNGGSWNTIHNASAAIKTVTGLGNGTYDYRVQACNNTGCSAYTATQTAYVARPPGVPTSISISPNPSTSGNHTVTWGASAGSVTQYRLQRSDNGSSYAAQYSGSNRSYGLNNLANGSYTYRVRACKTTGSYTQCSAYRTSGAATVTDPNVPETITFSDLSDNVKQGDSNGTFTVNWAAAPGTITAYQLQQRLNGGAWSTIHNGSARSKSRSGLATGTYQYRVRACNGSNCSNYSGIDTVYVAITPPIPAAITVSPSPSIDGSHTVSWTAVSGAVTYYDSNRRINGAGWTNVYDGPALSAHYTGQPNGRYEYIVRACQTTGSYTSCSGWAYAAVANVTLPPGVPGALSASGLSHTNSGTDSNGVFVINWGAATGTLTAYRLEQRRNNGSWSVVYNSTGLTLPRALTEEGVYDYRLRACNATACSPYTALYTVTYANTIDPPPVPAPTGAAYDPDPLSTAPFYGNLRGTLKVPASGTARFSVPLIVPPGTAGMAPELTLNYDSQRANGMLGLGWSLGGLSTIHRCPKSLVQDGAIHSVNYTAADALCLDGERLIAISGVVGASGTEYRTEIDQFSKIVSHGTAPDGGPLYFTVETKNGERIDYGSSTDARIEVEGRNLAAVWAMNKIADTVGNYLTIAYAENNATGEYYPTRIDYSGHEGRGLAPYNAVVFEYRTDRDDVIQGYTGGAANRIGVLLSHVKTYAGAVLVKDYQLAYETMGLANLSRLTSISDCDGQNQCGEPLTVAWLQDGEDTNVAFERADNNFTESQAWQDFQGDFDGDGRMDILWTAINPDGTNPSRQRLSLSNGDGTFSDVDIYLRNTVVVRTGNCGPNDWRWVPHVGDFNGNGLDDIYWSHINDGGFRVGDDMIYFSRGDGTFKQVNLFPRPHSSYRCASNGVGSTWAFGDFNGDGIMDRLSQAVGDEVTYSIGLIHYGRGDGTFDLDLQTPVFANGDRRAIPVDFNGDGLTDVFAQRKYYDSGAGVFTGGYEVYINNGTDLRQKTDSINLGIAVDRFEPMFGDFNGDGITDIMWPNRSPWGHVDQQVAFWIGRGDGTFIRMGVAGLYEIRQQNITPHLGDFNGDGLSDVMWYVSDRDQRILWLGRSDGTGVDVITNLDAANGIYVHENPHDPNTYEFDRELRPIVADFTGNGLADISWAYTVSDTDHRRHYHVWTNNSRMPNLVASIADSNGNRSQLQYRPLNDASVYTPGTGAVFPQQDVRGAASHVVSAVTTDNGIGGSNTKTFRYSGLKVHRQGLGGLGFAEVITHDQRTDTRSVAEYRQDFPYIGLGIRTTNWANASGTPIILSQTVNSPALHYPHGTAHGALQTEGGPISLPVFPFIGSRTTTTSALNSALSHAVSTVTEQTDVDYDLFGNPVATTVTVTGDGKTYRAAKADSFGPSNEDRRLGRLTRRVETTSVDGVLDDTSVRTTEYTYDSTTRLITEEVREPGTGYPLELTTRYTYDEFGNRTTISAGGPGVASRVMTRGYDARGQFATVLTNPLGHRELHAYDPRFGLLTETTDANQVRTCLLYDSFGRRVLQRQYCGTTEERRVRTNYWRHSSNFEPRAVSVIEVIATDSGGNPIVAPNRTYYDVRDREVRTLQYGFDGTAVLVEREYDEQQRLRRTSQPSFYTDPSQWMETFYDSIGRVYRVDYPAGDLDGDGNVEPAYSETFIYNGFERTTVDAKGRHRSETKDARGRLVRLVEDATNLAITTQYRYNSRDFLTAVEDARGNLIQISYDRLGRKVQSSDPDMGDWIYAYSTFGELLSQTDALGNVTTFTYDTLGRPLTQGSVDGTSRWEYDQATGAGVGQVSAEFGPTGTSKTYVYDNFGRATRVDTHMGLLGQNESFTTLQSFDALDRLSQVRYPAVGGETLALNYHYNQFGFLHYITDNAGQPHWIADEVNARGQLGRDEYRNRVSNTFRHNMATGWLLQTTSATTYGDSVQGLYYTHDQLGNVLSRQARYPAQDLASLLSGGMEQLDEHFAYDSMDRISTAGLSSSGYTENLDYRYDVLGNIAHKSDVGNYTYGGLCSGVAAGPHAVTQAGSASYCYDRNGNMTTGDGRNVSYTAHNKPTRIVKGGHTVDFYYGADRSRLIKRSQVSGQTDQTYYVGLGNRGAPLYEKTVLADGTKNHLLFLYAGDYHNGHPFAQLHWREQGGQLTKQASYFHRDHLGSVAVVSDSSGQVSDGDGSSQLTIYSYDVWGKRRHSDGGPDAQAQYADYLGNLSYTGQENVPEVGLIHLNGRVYDPALGRMLSADPNVPDPGASIGYNRYVYVDNNPMKYVDPTGFDRFDSLTGPVEHIRVTGSQFEYSGDAAFDLMFGGVSLEYGQIIADIIAHDLIKYPDQQLNNAMLKARATGHRWRSIDWVLLYAAPEWTGGADKFGNGSGGEINGAWHIFETPEDAVVDLLLNIAEKSQSDPVRRILERGGDIIPVDGGYTYNNVDAGLPGKVKVGVRVDAVAWVHSHPPDNSPNISFRRSNDAANVKLSYPADVMQAKALNKKLGRSIPAYLGASDGAIRRFDPGAYRGKGVEIRPPGFLQYRKSGEK